ncbi:MAG: SGNH/GDSL hydrolase family protein [Selenomonas sp.]|nr:SGNH/GDSL hydrolase family protein [Selenomonas sp.]
MLMLKKRYLVAGIFAFAAGVTINLGCVQAADSSGVRINFGQTEVHTAAPTAAKQDEGQAMNKINNVQLVWQEVPSAVRYQVVILKSAEDTPENIALTYNQVYTNGLTVDLHQFGTEANGFYWKVCPLDYNGQPVGNRHFTKPRPIKEGGSLNVDAPRPTTQFERMDYMPLYPVYSWIPYGKAKHHEVQVYQVTAEGDKLIRTLQGGEYDVYEDGGYTLPGNYYWRVRSLNSDGSASSNWSAKSYFTVEGEKPPFAALGDSITHGGGAMSVSPGYLLYDWESYSQVPVKNLGYSGNTTGDMLERFERDVLPAAPRVLVVMGGVNDYRLGTYGSQTVANLQAIKEKCDAYGIIVVFLTPTPINPTLMVNRAHIDQPPYDWQVHQRYVNDWVMRQQYHVDVATALTDSMGNLRSNYTTDGLHPDFYGKKYIGEQVGRYLQLHFAWLTGKLKKKAIPVYNS